MNSFEYFIYFKPDFECFVNSLCGLQFCLFFFVSVVRKSVFNLDLL